MSRHSLSIEIKSRSYDPPLETPPQTVSQQSLETPPVVPIPPPPITAETSVLLHVPEESLSLYAPETRAMFGVTEVQSVTTDALDPSTTSKPPPQQQQHRTSRGDIYSQGVVNSVKYKIVEDGSGTPESQATSSTLEMLAKEYSMSGNRYHARLPVVIVFFVSLIVAASVVVFLIQKSFYDNNITDTGLTLSKQTCTFVQARTKTFFLDVSRIFDVSSAAVLTSIVDFTNDTQARSLVRYMYETLSQREHFVNIYSRVDYAVISSSLNLAKGGGFIAPKYEWFSQNGNYMSYYSLTDAGNRQAVVVNTSIPPQYFNLQNTTSLSEAEIVTDPIPSVQGVCMQLLQPSLVLPGGRYLFLDVFVSLLSLESLLESFAFRVDDVTVGLYEIETQYALADSDRESKSFNIAENQVHRVYVRNSQNKYLRHVASRYRDRLSTRQVDTFATTIDETISFVAIGRSQILSFQIGTIVVIQKESLLQNVEVVNTQLTIVISVVYSVVVIGLTSLIIFISSRLLVLTRDMASAASMRFEDIKLTPQSYRSYVHEIWCIQMSFLIMVEILKIYRQFLPEGILRASLPTARRTSVVQGPPSTRGSDMCASHTSHVGGTGAGSSPERSGPEPTSTGNTMNAANNSLTPAAGYASATFTSASLSNDGGAGERERLMEHQVGDDIDFSIPRLDTFDNVEAEASVVSLKFQMGLNTRPVTILCLYLPEISYLSIERPAMANSMSSIVFSVAISVIEQMDGVVLSMGCDKLMVTFNGHRTCARHEHQACLAATTLGDALRSRKTLDLELEGLRWLITIGSGICCVGTSGCSLRRSAVTLGPVVNFVERMAELFVIYDEVILATAAVIENARHNGTTRIVDVLVDDLSLTHEEVFVYEVLSAPLNADDLKRYNIAFSEFRSGNYKVASERMLDYLREVEYEDPLGVRLLKLCGVKSLPKPYHRKRRSWDDWDPAASRVPIPAEIELKMPASSNALTLKGTGAQRVSSLLQRVLPKRQLLTITELKKDEMLSSPLRRRSFNAGSAFDDPLDASVKSVDDLPKTPTNDAMVKNAVKLLSDGSSAEIQDDLGRNWRRSEKSLGKGAFGEVYLGMGVGGDLVAIKVVQLRKVQQAADMSTQSPKTRRRMVSAKAASEDDPDAIFWREVEEILKEVALLSELRHDNIVGYEGCCVDNGCLVMLMEYVPGGSLYSIVKEFGNLSTSSTQRYVRDVLRGLAFLHKNNVIHRDVKPHNVLVMIDGQCKLTDFGASAKLGKVKSGADRKVHGTPLYMAPEQANGQACLASDIWGVGILTHQLLTGHVPYTKKDLENFNPHIFVYRLGHDEGLQPVIGCDDETGNLTDIARKFLESIFVPDPTKRPTAEQLLSHPFLL